MTPDNELEETIAESPVEPIVGPFFVTQLPARATTPAAAICAFWDRSETTIVTQGPTPSSLDPSEGPFAILRLRVARPFVARGFLAAATAALAEAEINVYILSTFSFDFVLVREEKLQDALVALDARGFPIREANNVW